MRQTGSTETCRGEVRSPSNPRRRNSIRLHGFDYSQPGEYFVTVCTVDRKHIFGDVMNGQMWLSTIGKIVGECWQQIPEHFPNVKQDIFQIMPNHVHGIIQIKEQPPHGAIQAKETPVGVEYIQPLQNNKGKQSRCQHVTPNSLESIIRSFKAAVTREVQRRKILQSPIWQRSFYDHIIRDEIDQYFIEQYIELNPIMWDLDSNNPNVNRLSIDEVRKFLREKHGLDDYIIERVIECRNTFRDIQ